MRIAFAIFAIILFAIFIALPFAVPLDPAHYTRADENGQTFFMGFFGIAALAAAYTALYWSEDQS